ncbi:ABC transporter ATP-binding protein [Pseudarthrobacter niigatensis]|uniref:ABC-2 type transport system ATP-binding protein n=1 Tax=Pseudarthrobacter niigatensis TaxID=369935 RepID=A0AAJ1SSS1_9MICC|nr:ATP-binding cassette domain-containing protein [Pseudarthrobacter niigatensis]MDQ0146540.1 ABC-2 type transport system ATP-binding protein [Pseudarthrobacter niigatensis]MDQ0266705.1 ABC-2 type transport system ATP-binding protein [Pseudarthrobacter niigatensis]
MTSGLAIETRGLSKHFGQQAAVDHVDLAVPHGTVFGFLGPNGSGKTTTIRMLLGLAAASAGTVTLLGQEMPDKLHAVLPRVGALVEGPAFYPFLSGAANLHRLDSASPHTVPATRRARVQQALQRVGLEHAAGKRVHAYSLGMKQRLGIANALLSPRDLLVLDEPTNGLDPQGTREVRNLVRSLAHQGTTVFVSSHLLAEVDQMCTHAAVMSAGKLVAQGPLAELRQAGSTRLRLVTPDGGAARQILAGLGLVPGLGDAEGEPARSGRPGPQAPEPRRPQPDGETIVAALDASLQPAVLPEDVVARLVQAGVRVRGFAVERESLEDRFVALTGEGFDVAQ